MGIPNVRRLQAFCPGCNETLTFMVVLPKGTDVAGYLADAVARHDHKAYQESREQRFKIRIGQQKQRRR